jgi:two-component system, chemotaxis family, chemotaxis protein CheY
MPVLHPLLPSRETEMPDTSPPCVLVVEDNESWREWLAVVLRRGGYRVLLAANGEEALDHLRDGPRPDLILLDMLMPVLDGWHFLEHLKREGPQPSAPIIIVTSTILTREWAEDHGCCGFVRKPIEAEPLLEEVRRCLG